MKINSLKMLLLTVLIAGCSSLPRLKTVDNVDLNRFMGPWYVIAAIPTFIETKSFNGVETYKMLPDGSIDTTFVFNQGSFDGPIKRYNPRGFVVDKINNSTWKMQFIWPFKAEYLIIYLDDNYQQTIIARNARDYCWIMARTPSINQDNYDRLKEILSSNGYDVSKLRLVPQKGNN